MGRRLSLIREILLRPLWGIAIFIITAIGNIPTIIGIIGFISGKDLSSMETSVLASPYINFLSSYWWALLLIIASLGIAEGIYRKTSRFLGDRIEAIISIDIYPRHSDGYASVEVHNEEDEDLLEPELTYLELDLVKNGELDPMLNNINGGRANISQWIGGKDLAIRGKKSLIFNLAKHGKEGPIFLFDDGTESHAKPGIYRMVIAINGKMGRENKKIREVTKVCILEHRLKIIERVVEVEKDGEIIKEIKQATYIDIRDAIERTGDIQPSQLIDLDMNSFIRHIAGKE